MSGYIDGLAAKIVATLAEQSSEKPTIEIRGQSTPDGTRFIWTARTSPRHDHAMTSDSEIQAAVRELAREVGVL